MSDIPKFNPRWGKDNGLGSKSRKSRDKGTHLGWKWWHMRKQWLMMFPYCTKCGLLGTEVHHIKPRSTHPELTYDWRNLMTLCSFCHQKIHAEDIPTQSEP